MSTTYVLVDYENARKSAFGQNSSSKIPDLLKWTEWIHHNVIPAPVIIRFYHSWHDARRIATADLNSFNLANNDQRIRAAIFTYLKANSIGAPIRFEAATTLWRESEVLPTSRKHTTHECALNDCPRHTQPHQKLVDTMLVRDAIQLHIDSNNIVIVSGDDDLVSAYPVVSKYIVPTGASTQPGLSMLAQRANPTIVTDQFPYSTNAWTTSSQLNGMRRR